MCICVYVYVCIYTYMYVCMHVVYRKLTWLNILERLLVRCISMCICVYVSVCIYTYMYVCMHVVYIAYLYYFSFFLADHRHQCLHTCIHTYVISLAVLRCIPDHSFANVQTHTYMHTYIHTLNPDGADSELYACMNIIIHVHIQVHVCLQTHAYTHTYMHRSFLSRF
jgi:hypothetical protein